jgi:hypothetical protein
LILADITDTNKKFRKELNSGVAVVVLLSILAQADELLYGCRIAKLMEAYDENVPASSEEEALPTLIEKYGTPSEIVAAYLIIESRFFTDPERGIGSSSKAFPGEILRRCRRHQRLGRFIGKIIGRLAKYMLVRK